MKMISRTKIQKLMRQDPRGILRSVTDNLIELGCLNWMPDKLLLKIRYWEYIGRRLSFKNPCLFNAKLQWLKIYDRKPEYTQWVDKYEVREIIKRKVGEQYLNTLYGLFDAPEEIDYQSLPEQFVLKCTNGSGVYYICKDKKTLDVQQLNKTMNKWLKIKPYYYSREWPYKHVKSRIICEKYLCDDIVDYKFYCFNGEPKFLYTSMGDNTKGTLFMTFRELNWQVCPFYRKDHKPVPKEIVRPDSFEKMIDIARKLSQGTYFVRVDLFYVNDKIYFSELTLTPGGGFTPFSPDKYELEIGSWIKLDEE